MLGQRIRHGAISSVVVPAAIVPVVAVAVAMAVRMAVIMLNDPMVKVLS